MPTRLLKDCADILAPFFVEIFNQSLRTGSVPTVFKEAYIMPLIKKADLDVDDGRSYRPISNLPVLSKLLERLISRQLLDYITAEGLMPALQSAYRQFHSTETAVFKSWQIYCAHWITATWLYLRCLTSQQHLRSTTSCYYDDWRRHTVLAAVH